MYNTHPREINCPGWPDRVRIPRWDLRSIHLLAPAPDALLAAGLAIGLPALVAQARALAHGWFPAQALLEASGGALLSSPAAAVAAMTPMGVHTPGEFAVEYSLVALEAALAAGFLWFLRGNTLACVLGALVLSVHSSALVLLTQPNTGGAVQGYAAVAALVLMVAWAVAPAWRKPRVASQGE